MVKTALELAKDAIDILNEKGWHQGASFSGDSALCLAEAIGMTAMKATAGSISEETEQIVQTNKLRLTIEAFIPRKYPDDKTWVNIISWNDAPGRTKQEVMEVLDKSVDVLIPA